jgi:hypothetical protein
MGHCIGEEKEHTSKRGKLFGQIKLGATYRNDRYLCRETKNTFVTQHSCMGKQVMLFTILTGSGFPTKPVIRPDHK